MTNRFDENFNNIINSFVKPTPGSRTYSQNHIPGANPDRKKQNITPTSNSLKTPIKRVGITSVEQAKDNQINKQVVPPTELPNIAKQYPNINFTNLKPGEVKQLGNSDAAIEVGDDGSVYLVNVGAK
jgi:hypothetical protein